MWILIPQPGIEPLSPALESKVLSIGPLGKLLSPVLNSLKARAKCYMFLDTWGFPCCALKKNFFFWLFPIIYNGEGNGNPLQYSCLENPVDRGARWAAVHGVAQSRTRLKQLSITYKGASQVSQRVKNLPANAGDTGDPVSIPRLGEGNGNPLQYSCLENSINRGLVSYSPQCHKESDLTEATEHTHILCIKHIGKGDFS